MKVEQINQLVIENAHRSDKFSVNIFEFSDYKIYFKAYVAQLPSKGRGEFKRVAEKLNVSSTMISQIFNGDKHMSLELASDLADYLTLNEGETQYFFLLVDYARAGNFRLQAKLKAQIEKAQAQAKNLNTRLKFERELDDLAKATFYSSWVYSGVRMLSALPNVQNSQAIADRLNLPRTHIEKILDFLIKENLVKVEGEGLEAGARSTHIGAESPFVMKHHQNWRLMGFNKMQPNNSSNLFYTGPMSLSEETAQKVRAELPSLIEKITNWVVPSPSEVVRCLNIDWFEF